jgi:hypothetical protein
VDKIFNIQYSIFNIQYSIFNPQYEAGLRIQLERAMCLLEICGLGDTKCVNVIVKNNPPAGGESEKSKKTSPVLTDRRRSNEKKKEPNDSGYNTIRSLIYNALMGKPCCCRKCLAYRPECRLGLHPHQV